MSSIRKEEEVRELNLNFLSQIKLLLEKSLDSLRATYHKNRH